MRLFEAALEAYGQSGLAVIATAVDPTGWDAVQRFPEEHKPPSPVIPADESVTRALRKVSRLPMSFSAHESGTIVSKRIGSMSGARIMGEVEFLLRNDGLPETSQAAS